MTSGKASGRHESLSQHSPQSPNNMIEGKVDSRALRSKKRRRLTRLVSQDELGTSVVCKDLSSSSLKPSGSSLHCISECGNSSVDAPLPNPLDDSKMLKTHVAALRLEADLHPIRLLLARLMAHPTHNRKGLFNQPVDPVALGLPDYHLIVKRPMDLGIVKRKLHAVAYKSRQEAAEDIRLVFTNAVLYNPPHNFVHKCAAELLVYFEDSFKPLDSFISSAASITLEPVDSQAKLNPMSPATLSRAVSVLDGDELVATDSLNPSGSNSMQNNPSVHNTSDLASKPLPPSTEQSGGQCATLTRVLNFKDTASATNEPPASSLVVPSVHPQPSGRLPPMAAPSATLPKRRSRLPPFLPHSCQSCQGRTCAVCNQGCLTHEPCLLVCQGHNCGGAKIRKGSAYFISKDGNRQYCEKCYINLLPVLPNASDNDAFRYKQDLLKRKNDEEIAEDWLACSSCSVGVHSVCAMHNSYVHNEAEYLCPDCQVPKENDSSLMDEVAESDSSEKTYTFVSGADCPVPISVLKQGKRNLSAESLPECPISSFIELKVRDCMKVVPNADKTITVRVISDCSRQFSVPEVVRRHFRMATESDALVEPPSQVNYQQKAIALFQKIDGLDVCIYCMYVQEYDGDDNYEREELVKVNLRHNKRVYIAYLDSVEHFRPRECRTEVYHEILVSYLATARARGYDSAQIWACPPSRGNSFIFWNHPTSQRTPTRERLDAWYHGAISRAVTCGIVTDVKSLFESEFQESMSQLEKEASQSSRECNSNLPSGRMICPPLLEGDFWVEEAVRIHATSISRNLKIRAPTEVCVWNVSPLSCDDLDPCPALQVATLVKDRVMTHPASVPFRRPVNAATLQLKNYHTLITKPMDLGTIYSLCVLGEYHVLSDVVQDVKLMVANAKKFNPVGHFVHAKADEVFDLFFQELRALTQIWNDAGSNKENLSWESYADMNMNLDFALEMPTSSTVVQTASVVIEDDRSSDGSRSMSSFVSVPTSPMSGVSSARDEESVQSPSVERTTKSSVMGTTKAPARRTSKLVKKAPPRKLDLLSDGPDAVMQSMVGDDFWLLDKRNPTPPKGTSSKKGAKRRRRSVSIVTSADDPAPKRRRQSWLGEEVGDSVRKMRTSFFTCFLSPKTILSDCEEQKLKDFQSYVVAFRCNSESPMRNPSPVADARCGLLELSQYRHFEFDTLRRAKYSSMMLLYHLNHKNAPGLIPACTTCKQNIREVRWHKVKKIAEKKRVTKTLAFTKSTKPPEPEFTHEELCATCHALHSGPNGFIPIPVSLKLD